MMDGYDVFMDFRDDLPEGQERAALTTAYDQAWTLAEDALGYQGKQVDLSLDTQSDHTIYQKAHYEDGEDCSHLNIARTDLALYKAGSRFQGRQYCIMDSPGHLRADELIIHESIHALHDQLHSDLASAKEAMVEGVAEVGAYQALLKAQPEQETFNYVSNWVAHHLVAANLTGKLSSYSLDEISLPFDLPDHNREFIQSQLDWAKQFKSVIGERNREVLSKQGYYSEGFVDVCRELSDKGRTLRDVAENGLGGEDQ